jgi:O-antigen/teichoic acid export membrane protein
MEAAFGDMWVKGEMETLQKNFRTFEYLLFSFTSVIFSCLGILILPFIEIYTKGVTDTEYIRSVLAILITITEGIYCIRQPYLTLVYATGSYQETKNGALVEALVNVVLTFALVPLFGISGAIIGTLVANVFRTTQFAIYISKNILNRNITEVVKRVLWVLLNIAIIIGISCVLLHFVSFSVTWFGWLAEAFVVFIIAVIVTLIMSFLFYCKDLRNLVELLIRTIKK